MTIPIFCPGIMGPLVNLFINNLIIYKNMSLMKLVYLVSKISKYLVGHSKYHLHFHTENNLLCFAFLATKWKNISGSAGYHCLLDIRRLAVENASVVVTTEQPLAFLLPASPPQEIQKSNCFTRWNISAQEPL